MKKENTYKKRIFLANSRIEQLAEVYGVTKRTIYNALSYYDIQNGNNNEFLRKIRETALKDFKGVIVEID